MAIPLFTVSISDKWSEFKDDSLGLYQLKQSDLILSCVHMTRESRKKPTCMYSQLLLDESTKAVQWRKERFFAEWCWNNWTSTCREKSFDPYLTPYPKIN